MAVLLSPSGRILEYDHQTGQFSDTGLLHQESDNPPVTTPLPDLPLRSCTAVNLLGEFLLTSGGHIIGTASQEGKTSYLEPETGIRHTLTASAIYRRLSPEGEVLFQRDLSSLLERTYVVPLEFLAYDGTLYVPGSRFIVRSPGGEERVFLVQGEPQASTVTADGVYTTNYTEATIYYYPFSVFDEDPDSVNMIDPERFLLADIENQCRPQQMETSKDGRYLVVGTGPMYGQFGGAVSVYDLKEQRLLYTQPHVVQNHLIISVKCSADDPNLVWLGTGPQGEHTEPPVLEEPAHLILWDIEKRSIVLDIIPDPGAYGIHFIVEWNGRVYCTTGGRDLFSFDAKTGAALAENTTDDISDLLLTRENTLLGANYSAIVQIDGETLRARKIAGGFSSLSHLTEDPVTGALYVFDKTELFRIRQD